MRLSDLFARTLRDDPSEAEVSSHRLLLRAAFIRQLASGVYTTMPLGLRTLRKIEDIVRSPDTFRHSVTISCLVFANLTVPD